MHEDRCQRVIQFVGDTGEQGAHGRQLFTLVQRFLLQLILRCGALPFHHPSELDTDLHPNIEQHGVWLLYPGSIELHHTHDFSAYQDGAGKNALQSAFFGARCAAKRWIRGHIGMPRGLTRSDDASNDVMPYRRYMQGLRGLLERRKALWRVEMPDGARYPLTGVVWGGKVDMANRPARVCTDLIQRQLEHCLGAGGLVCRGSDGLQQL